MHRDLRKPARLDRVLSSVLKRRRGLRDGLKSEQIFVQWPDIVGRDLSERLYPLEVKGKTLVMGAVSSTWAQEAAFLRNQILDNIKGVLGKGVVTDIRVKVQGEPIRRDRGQGERAGGSGVGPEDEGPTIPGLGRGQETDDPKEMLERLRRADEYVKDWRKSQGWPKCPICQVRFPPAGGEEVCPACRRVEVERQKEQVRRVLEEAPWMTPEHLMHETGVDISLCRPIRDRAETFWRERIADALKIGSTADRRFPRDFRRRVLQLMMLSEGAADPELTPKRVDEVCGSGVGELFFQTQKRRDGLVSTRGVE